MENKKRITFLILLLGISMIIIAFFVNSSEDVFKGLVEIITSPSVLVTDYIAYANLGAALLNAGLVTLIGLGLAWVLKAEFNGLFLAAIFTISGFSFFGKNVFNIWPIFLGVFLYNHFFFHRPVKNLIATLLFSTAIGPIVSQIAFGFGWGYPGLVLGIIVGIFAGALFMAIMGHVKTFHHGYNLYNAGTTAGFVGIVVCMMIRSFGVNFESVFYWSTEYTNFLFFYCGGILIFLTILGFLWGGKIKPLRELMNYSGRSGTDFVEKLDLGTTLLNMAAVGAISLLYIFLVNGDVNGAVIAGIFIIIGFGGFGKHPKNILPIMIGIYLSGHLSIWNHNDPGPLIAALFGTALAPIAGKFGFIAGIIAGAMHLPMVMHTGSMHGYMNLYNNGFAAGLVSIIIIGIISGWKPEKLKD